MLAIGLLGALFLTVAAKLVEVQLVEHERWQAAAERIHVREQVQAFPRGRIYDRDGLLLAFDVPAVSVALDNFHMTKPELLEGLLQRYLGLSAERARELIYRPKYFTWLARKVDPETAEGLKREAEELGVRGLLFLPEWKRVYPQGSLASNVLGFAGLDNQGLEGIELAFDEILQGKPERRELVLGADGTILDERVLEPGRRGSDLYLTLDARIQRVAERAIQQGVRRTRAKGGFAVVLDPRTGEVLSLAQDKTYDLNAFERSAPEERKNLAVAQPFEPGSTFKPFAMLAALEAGVVHLNEKISGDSPVVIAGHPFRNAEHIDYGPVTPTEIIQHSINTGMIRVALRLGEERLHAFLERLGFGKETGIELPGEVPGWLPPLERWSKLEIGAIPIGQGIATTGVQLASRYAAIANGGRLVRPRVVARVEPFPASTALSARGEILKLDVDPESRPIASLQNIRALTQMMIQVVEDGTGVRAKIPGFSIAGKSGTGQKAIPGRGYVKGKYTSLFAGFFPADDPQYVILVVLDEPGTREFYGGLVAAPIFKEIAEGIIELEHVLPELDG
jgi:cell division protein FtsI/penicillin-binding protein 2